MSWITNCYESLQRRATRRQSLEEGQSKVKLCFIPLGPVAYGFKWCRIWGKQILAPLITHHHPRRPSHFKLEMFPEALGASLSILLPSKISTFSSPWQSFRAGSQRTLLSETLHPGRKYNLHPSQAHVFMQFKGTPWTIRRLTEALSSSTKIHEGDSGIPSLLQDTKASLHPAGRRPSQLLPDVLPWALTSSTPYSSFPSPP